MSLLFEIVIGGASGGFLGEGADLCLYSADLCNQLRN